MCQETVKVWIRETISIQILFCHYTSDDGLFQGRQNITRGRQGRKIGAKPIRARWHPRHGVVEFTGEGIAVGLFGKKKSDKHVVVLMMDCDASSTLRKLMEDMTDARRQYAMDGVCQNFIRLVYAKRLKKYRDENVMGVFPNYWDAPLYRQNDPRMEQIALSCAEDYIRKNLPGVDPEQAAVSVDPFPDKPYAGIFIEY